MHIQDQVRVVVCGSSQELREAADVKLQELEQHEPPPKEDFVLCARETVHWSQASSSGKVKVGKAN
eukprot:401006-Amphidinium_carterae.1